MFAKPFATFFIVMAGFMLTWPEASPGFGQEPNPQRSVLQAARPGQVPSPRHPTVKVANLVGLGAGPLGGPASALAHLGAWANQGVRADDDDGCAYSNKSEGFAVRFPNRPDAKTVDMGEIKVRVHRAFDGEKALVYLVQTAAIALPADADPDEALEEFVQGYAMSVRKSGGKLTLNKKLGKAAHPGRSLEIKLGEVVMRGRVYLADNQHLYLVLIIGSPEDVNEASGQFFDSFRITPRPVQKEI